jgi:hypothetical protein
MTILELAIVKAFAAIATATVVLVRYYGRKMLEREKELHALLKEMREEQKGNCGKIRKAYMGLRRSQAQLERKLHETDLRKEVAQG